EGVVQGFQILLLCIRLVARTAGGIFLPSPAAPDRFIRTLGARIMSVLYLSVVKVASSGSISTRRRVASRQNRTLGSDRLWKPEQAARTAVSAGTCRFGDIVKSTKFPPLTVVFLLLILMTVFWGQRLFSTNTKVATIPYSQFLELAAENGIDSVTVTGDAVRGQLKEALPDGKTEFVTTRVDEDLANRLESQGIAFKR